MISRKVPAVHRLKYNSVSITYPGKPKTDVLNAFTFYIDAGTFLSVVGPSGCGKSSLLHVTAGFLKPTTGEVCLNDQPVRRPSVEIGFVSQQYSLFPWLTVEANIAFGLKSRMLSKNEARATVAELLDVIGLSAQRFSYPVQLSGGMQQRVALARAMAPRPSVLLLDEPFASLDADNRLRMRDLLLALWSSHRTTVVFVTHDTEEAVILGDRVLMMGTHSNCPVAMDIGLPRPRNASQDSLSELAEVVRHHYRATDGGIVER